MYVYRGTLGENKADYRELIDAALLAIAQNNYKDAYKHFENAYITDSNKVMVSNYTVYLLICSNNILFVC